MRSDYIPIIEVINQNINSFNLYLKSDYIIPVIDIEKITDDSLFRCITDKSWNEYKFPNAEKKGIYFIFGYNYNIPIEKALYIGKASFYSTIGRRLFEHLRKNKNDKNYTRGDKNGNIYKYEYITSIDLESIGLDIFSSSLEEFLIKSSKKDIHLLNGTGNFD